MQPIQFSTVIIHKIETMSDGSLKIVLITREMQSDEMNKLFMYYRQETIIKIDEPIIEKDLKTASQRLRAVLFILWEKMYKGQYKTFNTFYDEYMEKIIQQIKDKLN